MTKIILLIILFIILTAICGYFTKSNYKITENFESKQLKDNYTDIYDSFYSNVYDELFKSDIKNEYEIYNLKEHAFDKYKNSNINILDLGCGTGRHLELLTKYKYKCVGLDKSKKMLIKIKKIIRL